MRIAFVSTNLSYPWGGADALWTRTADYALRQGHPVLVAASPLVAEHPRVAALATAGATVHQRAGFTQHRGRADRWRQAALHLLRSRQSLTAALDSFQPDFVLINQGGVFDFLIEDGLNAWLAKTARPFALICQSNDERDRLDPNAQLAAQRVLARAAHTFFVSTHNRDHAARQCGAPVPNAIVVPNPVELPPELPLAWPESARPRFAVVARLETDPKGLDVLLDALAAAPTEGDWGVDVYGRGPDESRLRARMNTLGLDSRVSFCGYQPDVRQIWAHHHCLLMSSRREGCALAMLEALACGRPVLTTDVGGARDWVEPGINGFICRPGDAAALGGMIQLALSQADRWREMGAASARVIQLRHTATPEVIVLNAICPATARP